MFNFLFKDFMFTIILEFWISRIIIYLNFFFINIPSKMSVSSSWFINWIFQTKSFYDNKRSSPARISSC